MNYGLRVVCVLLLTAMAGASDARMVRAGAGRIPGEYIVVLEDELLPDRVPEVAQALAHAHRAETGAIWRHGLKGFFARMSEADAERLSGHPLVKFVEENAEWFTSGVQQTNVDPAAPCDPTTSHCPEVADNRLWHLDRLDQSGPAPNHSYGYCADAPDVTVYVVDGGVNRAHQEFGPHGARVLDGFNATGAGTWLGARDDGMPAYDPCLGFAEPIAAEYASSSTLRGYYLRETQASGHGTAVASVLGGRRIGVAKNVAIVPVKVIRCDLFSARPRVSSRFYQLHETMFVPRIQSDGNVVVGQLFRAVNAGTTAASTDVATWPTSESDSRIVQDGSAQFQAVHSTIYGQQQNTAYVVAGLNWIAEQTALTPRRGIVLMSTGRLHSTPDWPDNSDAPTLDSVEAVIETLIENGVTVIASANNQNGSACDTIPAGLSRGNPNPLRNEGVITAGGSMLVNRPWPTNAPPDTIPANPAIVSEAFPAGYYGEETPYDRTKAVRDARWICGAGDSSGVCMNTSWTESPDPHPDNWRAYNSWQAGSNGGQCVTLFAPAKNVTVASVAAANAYRDPRVRGGHASGTSWSAPLVAGAAAHLLQENPQFTPAEVEAALIERSVEGTLDAATLHTRYNDNVFTGTPNRLLRLGDVRITSARPRIAPAPPGVTLSVDATGGGLSYEWFRVHADFDPSSDSGAFFNEHDSSAGSSDRVASTPTFTVTAPGRYWARATGSCGSDDSKIVTLGAGAFCATQLPPDPPPFTASAHGDQVVQVGSQCTWAATSNESWIAITAGATGSGNGTVTYALAANPSTSPRSGTIVIGLSALTVTQAASPTYVRGDFNGDGDADLFWQHAGTNQLYLWHMHGTEMLDGVNVNPAGAGWKVVATHDFDGDRDSDLLWQNADTWQSYIWYMNDNTYVSAANMNNSGSHWWIVSAADFDTDGDPDVLWQHQTTGQMYLWYMAGNLVADEANVNSLGSSWTAAGTGDFNGDGRPDIVWRNPGTGANKVWFMNRNLMTSEGDFPPADTAWRIAAVGDYNGDGKDDLVFQYIATGQNYVWFMNGTARIGESNLNNAGSAAWTVVAPR